MNTRGAVDIANVDQALYREDLGIKVTNAGYEEYKKGEGLFGKAYEEIISSNTTALEQNRAGLQSLNDFISQAGNESIDKWYQEAEKSWVPVMIGTTKELSNPNVYKVPREVATQIINGAAGNVTAYYFEVPPGQITSRSQWTTNPGTSKETYGVSDPARQNYLVISPYISGKGVPDGKYVSEVDKSISTLQNQVKSAFYDAALPKYQELVANVSKEQESKSQYEQYIKTSEDTIAEAQQQKALRDTTKEAYKQQYTESKAARQALFAPLAKPEEAF
jgi:hypothetical protein